MDPLTNKIREAAQKLLKEGRVDVIIGFEEGTVPLHSSPCFVRTPDDVGKLIWNSFCENNLARYAPKKDGKTAVVAKGCDDRAIIELIKERQIPRDQIYIIGVPCHGMIDRARIEAELDGQTPKDVDVRDGVIVVKGEGLEKEFKLDDFRYPSCQVCTQRNPVEYDELMGDPVEETEEDDFADIEAFEALSDEERREYFSTEMDRCIRCYACRNACPLCYCPECFVDASDPQWIGKSVDMSDTTHFHIMRAFHLAGRCVECGACERACPLGIDIRKLNRKLGKDIWDTFGYKAGTSLEEPAPLATYKPDDPEAFILEP